MSSGSKRNRNRRADTDGEDRQPYRAPHNLEAQKGVLGRALYADDGLELLATSLTPSDFFGGNHQAIADALIRTFEAGQPADATTVADVLRRDGLLEQIGGAGELVALAGSTVAAATAARYVEIIHDHATLRRLIESALDIANEAGDLPSDVHDLVVRSQQKLADVAANNGSRSYSSLAFTDVAALIAGGIPIIEPDFLTRSDGQRLLYAGRMNYFLAEPSAGKTMLALAAVAEVLVMGGSAAYLDYEDSPQGIVGRLLALGADAAAVTDRFMYVRPEGAFGPAERIEIETRLAHLNPDLVVIDGVGEALAREGANEDRNAEVIPWIEKMPRWFSRLGAAVLMLDHVPKPQPGQSGTRYARGAGAKLGAVDGAAYEVKVTTPFSRHRPGRLKLVTAKDRPGGVGPFGDTAAVISITPHADGERIVVKVDPPSPEGGTAATWAPTHMMEMISRELENSATELTPTGVKSLFGKQKPKLVQQAITRLEAEGYVLPTKAGSTIYLRVVKPYRSPRSDAPDHEDEHAPADDGARDLSDDRLFDDHPEPTRDELADRRRRKTTDPEDSA